MENEKTLPAVEMPATIQIGSDCYAAKVVNVSRSAAYCMVAYASDGEVVRFNRCADGVYRHGGTYRLRLGYSRTILDRCF